MPATWNATFKSLPLCGPCARSSVENEKLGVTTDVTIPFSAFCPAMPDRYASVWNTFSVFWLNVVIDDRDSEYEIPTRATPDRRNSFRNAVPLDKLNPVVDWL